MNAPCGETIRGEVSSRYMYRAGESSYFSSGFLVCGSHVGANWPEAVPSVNGETATEAESKYVAVNNLAFIARKSRGGSSQLPPQVLDLATYQLVILPTMVLAAVLLVAASASVMVSPLLETAPGALLAAL